MQLIQGFQPCVTENSRVLVLGSFPSVMSRSNEFYYGNNRNRFWPMMQLFFGGSIDTVEDKIKLLWRKRSGFVGRSAALHRSK